MAKKDNSERPISEILKIAFSALEQHEKLIDKTIAKLGTEKDELAMGAKKLNTSLEGILQKLSGFEQQVKTLKTAMTRKT